MKIKDVIKENIRAKGLYVIIPFTYEGTMTRQFYHEFGEQAGKDSTHNIRCDLQDSKEDFIYHSDSIKDEQNVDKKHNYVFEVSILPKYKHPIPKAYKYVSSMLKVMKERREHRKKVNKKLDAKLAKKYETAEQVAENLKYK